MRLAFPKGCTAIAFLSFKLVQVLACIAVGILLSLQTPPAFASENCSDSKPARFSLSPLQPQQGIYKMDLRQVIWDRVSNRKALVQEFDSLWFSQNCQQSVVSSDRSFDHGAFRVRVKDARPGQRLVFHSKTSLHAAKLYVDQRLVASRGFWNENDELVRTIRGPSFFRFIAPSEEFELVLSLHKMTQVHRDVPILSVQDSDYAVSQRERRIFFQSLATGCMVFMFLYHFSIFLFLPKKSENIYLALFCLLWALRSTTNGDYRWTLIHIPMSLEMQYNIELIPIYWTPTFILAFLHRIFPHDVSKRWIQLCFIASLLTSLSLFLGSTLSSPITDIYRIFILILIAPYGLYALFQSCRRRRPGAAIIATGASIYIATAIAEILRFTFQNDIPSLSRYGILVMMASQSLFLSKDFMRTFKSLAESETENHILINDLRKNAQEIAEKKALESNLAKAQDIWSGLLGDKSECPYVDTASFSLSADESGGDWIGQHYDPVHERYTVMIGDVSGHGSSSALVTLAAAGAARGVLDALAGKVHIEQDELLQTLASSVNQSVFEAGEPIGRHMTMTAMTINLRNGESSYLNAGHFQIYHRSALGLRPILEAGSVLGLSRSPRFGLRNLQLQEGDRLFLFTDGLLENRGPSGESIQERKIVSRLNETQRVDECSRDLVNLTRSTWQGAKLADDVSFILVEFIRHSQDLTLGRISGKAL